MSSSFEFKYDLGCKAAQADAKHDFKGAFSPDDIRQSVASMTNIAGNLQCDVRPQNEDSFLSQSILAPGASLQRIKESIRQEVAQQRYAGPLPNSNSIFSASVTDFYSVYYANRPGSGEEEEEKEKMKDVFNEISKDVNAGKLIPPAGTSQVQQALLKAGIRDNVFIICDVVYSALRKDLTFAGRPVKPDGNIVPGTDSVQQTFYWLQTPQTQYDPGPKSNIESDKGYGWKTKDSYFKFAWQNILPSKGGRRATVYNPWPTNTDSLTTSSPEYPESMICTNHRMVMSVNCPVNEALWLYKKHDAVLLFVDPNTNRMTYANKSLASKKPKKFSLSSIMSFFGAKASQLVKGTFEQILGKSLSSYISTDFSTKYQILAKRCGDMPQALACLQQSIPYCVAIDGKQKMSENNVKYLESGNVPLLTNGNHMYASYDRIAIAQALNYRVPLVYFDQPGGNSVIFVAKRLTTICQRLDNVVNDPVVSTASAAVLKATDESYRNTATLKSFQSKLDDIAFILGKTGELLLLDKNAVAQVTSYVEKYSQKGPSVKPINRQNAAHLSYAEDELLRTYIGAIWCSLASISAAGTLESDLTTLATPKHMNELAATIAAGYENFTLQALSITSDPLSFENARASQVLRQTIEKEKVKLVGAPGGIEGLVIRFEFGKILASSTLIMTSIRDALQKVPARFSECTYAEDIITNLTRMTDNYEKIKNLLVEKDKVISGTKIALRAFDSAYEVGVGPIVDVIRGSSGNVDQIVSKVREQIVQKAPAGLLGNVFSLQPCAYSLVQVRAQRAAPDIDELQVKYGKAFYQIRDARFQIETLMAPIWKAISESNLAEQIRESFPRIMIAFTNRLAKSDSKVNYSEAMRALAASCNKRLIDLFDIEDTTGMQTGGANPDIGIALRDLDAANASVESGMISPEQQKLGAEAAISIDSFVRVLGSVLFSNALVSNSYFTSAINEGESEVISLPKLGGASTSFSQEQLFEGAVRYAVGQEIEDVGSNVSFKGDYQNGDAKLVYLFNALLSQYEKTIGSFPVIEKIADHSENSFVSQLATGSSEALPFMQMSRGETELMNRLASNPYGLRKSVMSGLGLTGQAILPNFVAEYTYGSREAVPLDVSPPVAQPIMTKRLISSSDDDESDAETVEPTAKQTKRVRIGGKSRSKKPASKRRTRKNK